MQLDQIRSQLRPPCPVIDVHVHPLQNFGAYPIESPEQDVRLHFAAADRAGITYLCMFSIGNPIPQTPTPEEFRKANDWTLAMWEFERERLLPFCYVSPEYPGESVKELDRCIGQHRMCGIKLWVARRAIDVGLDPILEKSVEYGVPVLQHSWIKTTGNLENESFPADVANLGQRHPKANIVMAHLNGCGLRGIEDVVATPNVYVELGGGDPEAQIVDIAANRLGVDRLLFGSDGPIRHYGICLGKVMGGRFTLEQQKKILYQNASRLLPKWCAARRTSD